MKVATAQTKRPETQKDPIGGKFNQHLQNKVKIKSLENNYFRKEGWRRFLMPLCWEQSKEQPSTKTYSILIDQIHEFSG